MEILTGKEVEKMASGEMCEGGAVYDTSEKVVELLHGYRLENTASPLVVEKERMVGREKGIYEYVIDFYFLAIINNKNHEDEAWQ